MSTNHGSMNPSVPQPPPKSGGILVTPLLLAYLAKHDCLDAVKLVEERDAFGKIKYKQGLMTDDGRDVVEDARQEIGDLLQYAFSARIQGRDLEPLRDLLPALLRVLYGDD